VPPLATAALANAALAGGYANLEYDLDQQARAATVTSTPNGCCAR
jgi:hypothetical protein